MTAAGVPFFVGLFVSLFMLVLVLIAAMAAWVFYRDVFKAGRPYD